MTFKAFFARSVALSLSIVMLVVLSNVFMNEYGLFGKVEGRSIKIYGDERTSKYLLSFNYIPANFDGLLIGSSVSDNIDSKKFMCCRIYNASINGATVAELKILVYNVLAKRDLECVIVSLYPILTGSNEKQTSRMVPREYWGTLGSINTLDFYRRKILIIQGRLHDYFDDYGRYNYNLRKEGGDSKGIILQKVAVMKADETITIDEGAYIELDTLLKTLRARRTKIFAYYHPIPAKCLTPYEASYRLYQNKISALFDSTDVVWDYNTDDFLDFRKDYTNYCDEIHLSVKGIDYITRDINIRLSKWL